MLEHFALKEGLVKADGSVNQSRLAGVIGVQQPTISRILSGERTPDIDTAGKIAAVAGVPHGAVLRDFAPMKTSPAALVIAEKIEALPKEARELLERHVDVFMELLSRTEDQETLHQTGRFRTVIAADDRDPTPSDLKAEEKKKR